MSRKEKTRNPQPTHHEPPIAAQAPPVSTPGRPAEVDRHFWPADRPQPAHYTRALLYPCPQCNRVLLPSGGQAVVVIATGADVAYLRCKGCDHRWKLPVARSQK